MPIKTYRTTRDARKKASIVDRSALHPGKPHQALSISGKRKSGRGSAGKITIRHRGGGAKRNLRVIDFGQDKIDVAATVERVEYDPNRTAFIALLKYEDGDRRYRLAWDGIKAGQKVRIAKQAQEGPGMRLPLEAITPGSKIFDVEIKPGRGGQLLRSAGAAAILMDVGDEFAQLKMPSSEIRLIPKQSYATVGQASNIDAWRQRIGSAGRMRRLGRRPQVRGKAMNPVDHPHGGGEGGSSIGMKHPKTKWGKRAFGVKTRSPGKYSDSLIVARRKKRK